MANWLGMTNWSEAWNERGETLLRLHHGQCFQKSLHRHDQQPSTPRAEHQLKLTPGFAAKYNITRLVYFESFEDVRSAIEREKQIKAWTRAKRVALIESANPKWDDLSREWDQPQTFRFVQRIA
ncbi:MAG: hypothetical protein WA198_07925 [Candidatus Sulfotelmatobacter sp.]